MTLCYYTFRIMNMTTPDDFQDISRILRAIDHPARLQILWAIGREEACVCHLETLFGWRQAYISQHLMAMRKAGVLHSRRRGKFVYYRLADSRWLELVQMAASLAGVSLDAVDSLVTATPARFCKCPTCQGNKKAPTISLTM